MATFLLSVNTDMRLFMCSSCSVYHAWALFRIVIGCNGKLFVSQEAKEIPFGETYYVDQFTATAHRKVSRTIMYPYVPPLRNF